MKYFYSFSNVAVLVRVKSFNFSKKEKLNLQYKIKCSFHISSTNTEINPQRKSDDNPSQK